ncbi:hypothetical protein G6O69_30230 [Pseudenhygromyxa sp. WMMC2535]|uniref:TonB-dependent receptor n=1 Tax=Pseudenhygromyxa sp. WMMC2535 TaxID=2712867 RepID=UPI0015950D6B|nr:Plug and carboxypeptidase regulatory-like domain-containing protein [Pseudenhygromyxa sp. WMMC2535]NVB42139.1 hypothetical protein [Pseudenhygromyxa sp. WMMC2535]
MGRVRGLRPSWCRLSRAGLGLGLLGLGLAPWTAWAGPGEGEGVDDAEAPSTATTTATATLRGRVIEAGGSRAPIVAAVVMVVDAPPEVRPGKPAKTPLDPEAITWMLRAETDEQGRFELPEVPVGKVRVVIVAGGYARLEQWAEVEAIPAGSRDQLRLYLERDAEGSADGYRTEVVSAREQVDPPSYTLDGQSARHYAGAGDDPMLAALSMPGVARSPGGLAVLSFRGAAPTWTGYYLDGHPVPRGYHVLPIAAVLMPALVDSIEFDPGNYGPGYGGYGGGMVRMHSKAGGRDGVHGQAHVDLFDLGAAISAPVGRGALAFGLRRSHVDSVLGLATRTIEASTGSDAGLSSLLFPAFWDYLGRFDLPLEGGWEGRRTLSLRALGAGDSLRSHAGSGDVGGDGFEFESSFHRFDLEYRAEGSKWRALISPSLRLDSAHLEQSTDSRREATVFSSRMLYAAQLHRVLELELGSDLVYERYHRFSKIVPMWAQQLSPEQIDSLTTFESSRGEDLSLGMWVAPTLRLGDWTLAPALRMSIYYTGKTGFFRPEPRLDVRGLVHPKVELRARIGLYSQGLVVRTNNASSYVVPSQVLLGNGILDIPSSMFQLFDPRVEGEVLDGAAVYTKNIHASLSVQAELPWQLRLRATAYWREGLPDELEVNRELEDATIYNYDISISRRRGMGMELMLSRPMGEVFDGWIGYTLSSSRLESAETGWRPATFDQRHNLVVLLSASLPRGFRLGMRFRLVSGNPDEPVVGTQQIRDLSSGLLYTEPLRGALGDEYRPLFHQLDLRLDKRWIRRRTAISAYLDVQNVYNNLYPEAYVYSLDWSQREALFGLPIYPSLGVQVDF